MNFKKNRNKSLYLLFFILIVLLIFVLTKLYLLKFDSTEKDKIIGTPPSAILINLKDKSDKIISTVESNITFDFQTFMLAEKFKYADNSQLVFYVIAIQNGKYVVNAIAYDVYEPKNINVKIPSDTECVYCLFPEFKTVYAITDTNNTEISEIGLFDGREKHGSPIAGGGLSFRAYKIDVNNGSGQQFDFSIMSVNESRIVNSNSSSYGKYIFTLVKQP